VGGWNITFGWVEGLEHLPAPIRSRSLQRSIASILAIKRLVHKAADLNTIIYQIDDEQKIVYVHIFCSIRQDFCVDSPYEIIGLTGEVAHYSGVANIGDEEASIPSPSRGGRVGMGFEHIEGNPSPSQPSTSPAALEGEGARTCNRRGS
jgi:hypothetical protein